MKYHKNQDIGSLDKEDTLKELLDNGNPLPKSKKTYSIPQRLSEAIRRNMLVLFVGAGFSKNLNTNLPQNKKLPDWKKFTYDVFKELVKNNNISEDDKKQYKKILNQLNKKNELEEREKENGLDDKQKKKLEELRKQYPKGYRILSKVLPEHKHIVQQHISNMFRVDAGAYCEIHELALLLTDMIVTTNYDNAIETAYENLHGGARPKTIIGPLGENESQLNTLTDEKTKEFIFKVHGCATVPASCIIFEDEYEKLYKAALDDDNSGYYRALQGLEHILRKKNVLLIGVSFEDEYMKWLFDNACKGDRHHHQHFIITNNEDDEKRLKKISYLNCIKVSNYNTDLVEMFKELVREKFENSTSPNRLRQLILFRGLSDESIRIFNTNEKKFDDKVYLAKHGDEADSFFLVLKGIVTAEDEKGTIISIRKKGEIIGEFGFSVNESRIRNIVCRKNDTHVIEINRETIEKLTLKDQNVLWQNIVYMLYNKERENDSSESKETELRNGPLEWKKVAKFLSDKLRNTNHIE